MDYFTEKVKTSNISDIYTTDFMQFVACVLENNGLLNKKYWDDLDMIDQGHVTFRNFTYIRALLGPI